MRLGGKGAFAAPCTERKGGLVKHPGGGGGGGLTHNSIKGPADYRNEYCLIVCLKRILASSLEKKSVWGGKPGLLKIQSRTNVFISHQREDFESGKKC